MTLSEPLQRSLIKHAAEGGHLRVLSYALYELNEISEKKLPNTILQTLLHLIQQGKWRREPLLYLADELVTTQKKALSLEQKKALAQSAFEGLFRTPESLSCLFELHYSDRLSLKEKLLLSFIQERIASLREQEEVSFWYSSSLSKGMSLASLQNTLDSFSRSLNSL